MFKGCGTALITPFKNGKIDFLTLEKILDFQLKNKTDALIICGTTGEPSVMTNEEKNEVINLSIKFVNHKIPVFIGTGSNNTAAAVENTVKAEKAGADGVLVVTPYYNKCTQKGLVAHYKAISDATALPIIAYNVPGRTGVNILPQTLLEMTDIKNLKGIKEASGNIDQIVEIARLVKDKIAIYSGDDGIVVPLLSVGGCGVISVASNIIPEYMHNLVMNYLEGNTKLAADMQLFINPFIKALFSEVNPIPVKQAAQYLGLCSNEMRLPLTTMETPNAEKLHKIMQELKIIS